MLQATLFRKTGSWDFHRGSWGWIMAVHGGSCGHDPGISRIVRISWISWIHRIDEGLMDPSDR